MLNRFNLNSGSVQLDPHDELLLPELVGQLWNVAAAVERLVLGQVFCELNLQKYFVIFFTKLAIPGLFYFRLFNTVGSKLMFNIHFDDN